MQFVLEFAPADVSGTYRRQAALAIPTTDYDPATGDVIDPADLRMSKLFSLAPLSIVTSGATWTGMFIPLTLFGGGPDVIYWYNNQTGLEAALHENLFTLLFLEAIGQ